MSIEYRLVLAGDTSAEAIAERTGLDGDERPRPSGYKQVLTADLNDRCGTSLSVTPGSDGYVEADGDDGVFTWEPASYVSVDFDIDSPEPDDAITTMMTIVARLLATGIEDVALTVNSELLLLTRQAGVVRRHAQQRWWDKNPSAVEAIGD